MRFITLITVATSVLALSSQSASALPVQDLHQGSNGLSKRKPNDLASSGGSGSLGGAIATINRSLANLVGGLLPIDRDRNGADLSGISSITGSDNRVIPGFVAFSSGLGTTVDRPSG